MDKFLELNTFRADKTTVSFTFLIILKGVFAKTERGYRLNAIKKRF